MFRLLHEISTTQYYSRGEYGYKETNIHWLFFLFFFYSPPSRSQHVWQLEAAEERASERCQFGVRLLVVEVFELRLVENRIRIHLLAVHYLFLRHKVRNKNKTRSTIQVWARLSMKDDRWLTAHIISLQKVGDHSTWLWKVISLPG